MSDQTNVTPTTTNDAPAKRTRAAKVPDTVEGIARAQLRARGLKGDKLEGAVRDQMKVVRGRLRSTYWSALTKAAPKSYGARGAIKNTPNDRRPWGAIPASVARDVIKGTRS